MTGNLSIAPLGNNLITVGVHDLTLCPHYDRISLQQSKEKNMSTITVGSEFTTSVSGVTGIVQEIHEKPLGRTVLLLDVNGVDRWTTVK